MAKGKKQKGYYSPLTALSSTLNQKERLSSDSLNDFMVSTQNSKLKTQNYFNLMGFTLLEVLVVIVIAGILAAVGIPGFRLMISNHKFTQYSSNMEYLVKHAKIIAMEKTTNVGVCVPSSTQLILYNMGTNRGASICSGTELSNMTITSGDTSGYNISVAGSASGYAFSFDPRGLAIITGNVCVTNNSKYYKAVIDKASIRMQEGSGVCP